MVVTSRGCIVGKPQLVTPCPRRKCRRLLRSTHLRCAGNTDPPCEVSESVVTVRTTTSSLHNGLTHTTQVEEFRRTTKSTTPTIPSRHYVDAADCRAQQLLCMAEAPPPGSLAASSLMGKGLGLNMGSLLLGVVLTLGVQFGVTLLIAHQSTSKIGRWLSVQQKRWREFAEGAPVTASSSEFRPDPGVPEEEKPGSIVLFQEHGESVEWVNMCWRKIWRVYQRGLERWIMDLLQPLFDMLVKETGYVPTFLQRIKIVEFTLDHEAPYFSNMRRRTSRKDSDLSGVVDVRYTGGARMLLMLEVGQGRWRFKIPVMVSDLDLECKMWVKIRLAPICPWLGQISLAFVGPPNVKVQLSPYNRVRLMRIPVLQTFLSKLLTVDLPGLMVLPKRIEINIPPSITSVAEAAVGRDTIMRAVASAVLEADAAEQALLSALPLGPQTPAGGVSLPEGFCGELTVKLKEARDLPVWGFPWQSNPYCRLMLGEQAVRSRRDDDTSHEGNHKAPVWNQEFQFLVQDLTREKLEISVRDSHLTGKPDVGRISFALKDLPADGRCDVWLPLEVAAPGTSDEGAVRIELTYRSFEEDEHDSGYREAEMLARTTEDDVPIKDIQSAAAASSRAAVAASAAAAAIAITRAAAARAAAKAARAAKAAASGNLASLNFDSDEEETSSKSGTSPRDKTSVPPTRTSTRAELSTSTSKLSTTRPGSPVDTDALKNGFLASVGEMLQGTQQEGLLGARDSAAGRGVANGARVERSNEMDARETVENGTAVPNKEDGAPMNGNGPAAAGADGAKAAARDAVTALFGDGPITNEQLAALLAARMDAANAGVDSGSSRSLSDPGQPQDRGAGIGPYHHHSHMHAHLDPKAGIVVDIDPDFGRDWGSASSLDETDLPPPGANGASRPPATTYINGVPVLGEDWNEPSSQTLSSETSGAVVESSAVHNKEAVSAVSVVTAEGSTGSFVAMSTLTAQSPTSTSAELSTAAVATAEWPVIEMTRPGLRDAADSAGTGVDYPGVPGAADSAVMGVDRFHAPATATVLERETVNLPGDMGGLKDVGTNGNGSPAVRLEESPQFPQESTEVLGGVHTRGALEQAEKQQADARQVKRVGGFVDRESDGQRSDAAGAAVKAKEKGEKAGWSWTGVLQNVVRSVEGLFPPGSQMEEADKADGREEKPRNKDEPGVKAVDGQADGEKDTEAEKEKKGAGWWRLPDIKFEIKWGNSGKDEREEGKEAEEEDDGSMKDVVIPPDLPLEEIAKEVAKLKQESWKSKEDHVSSLWAKAVERNDRSWIMLLCFLVATAIFLLAFALYRLDTLPGL